MASRTRFFILRHLFVTLIENYVDAFEEVVKFANQHCLIHFEPDTKYLQDLIEPIVRILND